MSQEKYRTRFKIRISRKSGKFCLYDRAATRGGDFPRHPIHRSKTLAGAIRLMEQRIRMEWNRVEEGTINWPQFERRWNR